MNEFEIVLIPVGILFFFVGLWSFVLLILSFMSGWSKLAEKFHYPDNFSGKIYRFQSARMWLVTFSGVLEIGVNERGLYLFPFILFRPFHKPLLIPWDEIKGEPLNKFLFKGYRLAFRSHPRITLGLDQGTFDKISDYLPPKNKLP